MTKFPALIVSVLLAIVLTTFGVSPAWASGQGTSLTTSPISVDLAAKPGTSVSTTLQVLNNNSQPLNVTVQVDTFRASGTSGQAQILKPKPSDDFINWASFSSNSFVAQPGVWTPIKMTINVPSYAALGYYYAVLFKPSVVVNSTAHANVLKASNAILVLLNAQTANEHPSVVVTSFKSDKKVYEYLPASFSIDVYNNGNIFLPPTGEIYISNNSSFNGIIDSLNINTELGKVLPGTSRIYTVQWTDGFPVFVQKTIAGQPVTDKHGKAIEQLKWDFSQAHKLRFGKYYAKMVLVYNNGTQDIPAVAMVSFWVIPWKLIIGFILLIAILVGSVIFIVYMFHKLRKKAKWRV
jgi:hypothetical protein